MFTRILVAFCLLATATSHAALLGRAPLTPGGTDYQAYYDDLQNITWLGNANLAATSTFGVTGINPDGAMTWDKANQWIAVMNAANYLGVNGWRLPTMMPTGDPNCDSVNSSDPCTGYNPYLADSEVAHMFYITLENTGYRDTSGHLTGCSETSPFCLTNMGPFSNLQADYYWSGKEFIPFGAEYGWVFHFGYGNRIPAVRNNPNIFVWAVSEGDPFAAQSAVPLPAAAWLFGGALGALGLLKRRRRMIDQAGRRSMNRRVRYHARVSAGGRDGQAAY